MDVDELSEAFYPCTPHGLAEALWLLNLEIGRANAVIREARKEKKPIEQALLALMLKSGGEVIEGEHPPLRVVMEWEYDFTNQTGTRKPGLEFDRMKGESYYRQLDQDFERNEGQRSLEMRVLRNGVWFTRCNRCHELDSELLNGVCGTCLAVEQS